MEGDRPLGFRLPQASWSGRLIEIVGVQTDKTRKRDGQNLAAVCEQLRAAILKGELQPGASIPQGVLAASLGAGRTPLREALRMLQGEGLVISEPNRKVTIASLSEEDAEQLFVMRLALEVVATRITVPKLTSNDIAEMEGYLAQMEHYLKVGDQLGYSAPHRAFHMHLVAEAGPRVCSEIARLADHSERYRIRFGGSGAGALGRGGHRAILKAAALGQSEQAASQLASHYEQTARIVLRGLDPEWDLSRIRTVVQSVAPDGKVAPKVG